MSTLTIDTAQLTPEQLASIAPMLREAMRDKTWECLPLGEDVAAYLRAKRKRLTPASYLDYAGCLARFARHFADLRVEDFEPPIGSERLEEFLSCEWGSGAPRTYNKNLSILADFCKHWRRRGRLHGDPALLIERARSRQVYRTTFTTDQREAIIASQEDRRDRIALRLLVDYGLRKGALQAVQFKHFDHQRRKVTIFTKGQKVRSLPLPDPAFWTELELHILESEAKPSDYLLCTHRTIPVGRPHKNGHRATELRRFPARPMSSHGAHKWWYRCLTNAGIVPEGTTEGERMHKARHTAGQRLLDATGNLKAVQMLLGHSSIQTTGDVYADWSDQQLAASILETFAKEQKANHSPRPPSKSPRTRAKRANSGDGGSRTSATFPPSEDGWSA